MSDLSEVTIGAAVRLPEKYTSGFHILTVTKITGAQVHCGETRLRKADGLLIGAGDCPRCADPANEADVITYRIKVAQSRVADIKVTADNLIVVESLLPR